MRKRAPRSIPTLPSRRTLLTVGSHCGHRSTSDITLHTCSLELQMLVDAS
jgi:hypothetical protein